MYLWLIVWGIKNNSVKHENSRCIIILYRKPSTLAIPLTLSQWLRDDNNKNYKLREWTWGTRIITYIHILCRFHENLDCLSSATDHKNKNKIIVVSASAVHLNPLTRHDSLFPQMDERRHKQLHVQVASHDSPGPPPSWSVQPGIGW